MTTASNSLTEWYDRTCVSYRLQIQYIAQRHFVFLTNILDSSFLLEIKADDWQNVGCATYLLSGNISKTSRNTTPKTHIFSQLPSTHYSCATFLSIYLTGSRSTYVGLFVCVSKSFGFHNSDSILRLMIEAMFHLFELHSFSSLFMNLHPTRLHTAVN